MTTLDLIAALRTAIYHNNIDGTARLLDELEARMGPEALADLLEAILAAGPAAPRRVAPAAPIPVACA
ncbi:MAG: hypothetical protein HGA45_30770 [Chloroflexales bacterium]|nr:hypothetical protein [Chloroflexales bacterium]